MFDFLIAMMLIVAAVLLRLFLAKYGPKHEVFCKTCGHIGKPATKAKGNIGTEALLWLLFIVPGVIYSIWRLTTKHEACQKCGGTELIPPDSPLAKKLSQTT